MININDYLEKAREMGASDDDLQKYEEYLNQKTFLVIPILEPESEYKSFILSYGLNKALKSPDTERELEATTEEIKNNTGESKQGVLKTIILRALGTILGKWIYDELKEMDEFQIIKIFLSALKGVMSEYAKELMDEITNFFT